MSRVLSCFARLSARSLGLFRIAFAIGLLVDLWGRFQWVEAFYSNTGVLPNHAHLFNLEETGLVWSALHAFSTADEATFGFAVIAFFYIGFLLGYGTRVFHALSMIGFLSLIARNTLMAGPGDALIMGLGLATLLLPTGSRFSIDSLLASLRAKNEKNAVELNDRTEPVPPDRRRPVGWSPVSIAALTVLVLMCSTYALWSAQQDATWSSGTAVGSTLFYEMFVSDFGAAQRAHADAGWLKAITHLIHLGGYAIPLLLLFPFLRTAARLVALLWATAIAVSLALLFDLGIYPFALWVGVVALIPSEAWDAWSRRYQKRRAVTIIYDADCGVCLALSRLLKRADAHRHITFQGNDDIDKLWRCDARGVLTKSKMPKEITTELCDRTVVAVDREGRVMTEERAVAAAFGALPFGTITSAVLRVPGISHLVGVMYRFVAPRRMSVSVQLGYEACGIPVKTSATDGGAADASATLADAPAPSTKVRRGLQAAVRELLAAALLLAIVSGSLQNNPDAHSLTPPESAVLDGINHWARLNQSWDVFATLPDEQGIMVVDAQTKGGKFFDPLTGAEPQFNVLHGPRLGIHWASYLSRIQSDEHQALQREFRDYLSRSGGPFHDSEDGPGARVTGFDAYWVTGPLGPDAPEIAPAAARRRVVRFSRGGTMRPPPAPPTPPPPRGPARSPR